MTASLIRLSLQLGLGWVLPLNSVDTAAVVVLGWALYTVPQWCHTTGAKEIYVSIKRKKATNFVAYIAVCQAIMAFMMMASVAATCDKLTHGCY